MCGIISFIARTKRDFWDRDMALLEDMLVINTIRGRDSVGVFSTYRNNEVEALKLGSHPFNLFRCNEWAPFKDRMKRRGRIIVGHNRAATRGSVTTENAHPFTENNIILVHNGTLFNHDHLSKERKFEVDSHAICAALEASEVEEVLPKLHGAYALVWYDTAKRKLFAIRNDQRPLCLIKTDDMYVLSSEPAIAAMPMQRQDRKIEDISVIPPGTLVEFDLQGNLKHREIKTTTHTVSQVSFYPKNGSWRDCCKDDDGSLVDMEEDDVPFVLGDPPTPPKQTCALTNVTKNVVEETKITSSVGPTRTPSVNINTFASTLSVKELDLVAFTNTQKLHITHKTLTRDRLVLFKPHEFFRNENNGHYQFRGKLRELNEELIDVLGYFPEDRSKEDISKHFIGNYCVGRVLFVTHTSGGLSAYLTNIKEASDIRVYGGTRIPIHTWCSITEKCKCGKCGRPIYTTDRDFTAVTLRTEMSPNYSNPKNLVTIVCANCIEDMMTGEIKDAFVQQRTQYWVEHGHQDIIRPFCPDQVEVDPSTDDTIKDVVEAATRTAALQNRQSVSSKPGGSTGKVVALPAPKTIH